MKAFYVENNPLPLHCQNNDISHFFFFKIVIAMINLCFKFNFNYYFADQYHTIC